VKFFAGVFVHNVCNDVLSHLIYPTYDRIELVFSSIGENLFVVNLNFELMVSQDLVNGESLEFEGKQMEMAVLVDAVYCYCRLLNILNKVECSKSRFFC